MMLHAASRREWYALMDAFGLEDFPYSASKLEAAGLDLTSDAQGRWPEVSAESFCCKSPACHGCRPLLLLGCSMPAAPVRCVGCLRACSRARHMPCIPPSCKQVLRTVSRHKQSVVSTGMFDKLKLLTRRLATAFALRTGCGLNCATLPPSTLLAHQRLMAWLRGELSLFIPAGCLQLGMEYRYVREWICRPCYGSSLGARTLCASWQDLLCYKASKPCLDFTFDSMAVSAQRACNHRDCGAPHRLLPHPTAEEWFGPMCRLETLLFNCSVLTPAEQAAFDRAISQLSQLTDRMFAEENTVLLQLERIRLMHGQEPPELLVIADMVSAGPAELAPLFCMAGHGRAEQGRAGSCRAWGGWGGAGWGCGGT